MSNTQPATPPSTHLRRPLGTGRNWRRRLLLHHLPLAVVSGVLLILFLGPFTNSDTAPPQMDNRASSPLPTAAEPMHGTGQGAEFSLNSQAGISQLTVATGYVATVFLGVTLLVGPANLLLRRRNPVSTSLPRDVGTWAAVYSIVHVIVGLQVHGRGLISDVLNYFVASDGSLRLNSFGLGNWTGLAALVIVTGLLALSNDRSLRELKARRWKNLQRLNYALFALVVLHSFFYGALLRTTSTFTLILIFTVIAVLLGQLAGVWLWRRRPPHTPASQHEQQPFNAAD